MEVAGGQTRTRLAHPPHARSLARLDGSSHAPWNDTDVFPPLSSNRPEVSTTTGQTLTSITWVTSERVSSMRSALLSCIIHKLLTWIETAVGMRHFHKNHNLYWRPVINLDKLHVRSPPFAPMLYTPG